MVTLSYRSFSRSVDTKVLHTCWKSAKHTMLLSLELLQCVLAKPSMQYRSPTDLESNHRSIPYSARIAHISNPPGCDNCPAQESVCRGCSKKGHWQSKCHSSKKKINSLLQWTANQKVCLVGMQRRGRKLTS